MSSVQFDTNRWIWDGACYPQLFGLGGIMVTITILWLSTGYLGGIGLPYFPFYWLDLRFFYKKKSKKRPVRVYMDGCFDLMHYGHANALRQAKSLGDELVVGVVSDEEIVANKGPPVLSMVERLILVSGLKWVDEVIANAPYAITEEFMNTLFNKYNIDYIIHGDDPCLLPDGTDAYGPAKKAGRYKQIKRTEGVSSTDIVGRILSSLSGMEVNKNHNKASQSEAGGSLRTHQSHFLPTSRRIVQFSNAKGPGPDARVVYIDGAFDLFHAGHVEILRCARQLGDFLLVGVYSDQTVSERRGCHPIMHLHERSLSVLACRYVDEVIIGAPWEVTRDMTSFMVNIDYAWSYLSLELYFLARESRKRNSKSCMPEVLALDFSITTFNISLVVHGTVAEGGCNGEADPYATPRSMGIFKTIASPNNITSTSVARKIVDNHEAYKKRNVKKSESENKYYAEKKFVPED